MRISGNSAESRDLAYVMHPYTNHIMHQKNGPLVIARGQGVWVYDNQGNAYIEGMAGLWCTALGFGEQRLVEAASKQMQELPFYHLFASKSTNPAINLAEKLVNLAPANLGKVFFANSGSEANDTVVKLVWYYNNARGRPEKKKIIARQKAYHGVTVAAGSLTGLPYAHGDFDMPIAGILHTECPHHYMYAHQGESETAYATRLADALEAQIMREGPETIAAFIAEPVMGAGGVIVPPAGYFAKIQKVLRAYDILMIADEVICGFGRTGTIFGCEQFEIQPDMMTVAKALSSAYLPISAVLVADTIAEVVSQNSGRLGTFGHGYTYSGHPVAAAVALETLKIYEERQILAQVAETAPILQRGLRTYSDHPLIGEVRGIGLIAAVQLMQDRQNRIPFEASKAVAPYLVARAQELGLILRPIPGDVVAFSPPLIISAEEIQILLQRFEAALDLTWKWVQSWPADGKKNA